jgi:hypothetical protein
MAQMALNRAVAVVGKAQHQRTPKVSRIASRASAPAKMKAALARA